MDASLLAIPDSQLCKKATALAAKVSPNFLHRHCLRTFLFGQQLALLQQLTYDPELFYVSAILHDLGLTETFSRQQRYEVDGADAARRFALKHGLSGEKAEIIWDAIALHTSIGIANRKRAEVALVHLGASLDVFGVGVDSLAADDVHRIFEEYPRTGLIDGLTALFVKQIEQKPQVTPFTWLAEVGRCCVHGFNCLSYQDLIDNSPFDP